MAWVYQNQFFILLGLFVFVSAGFCWAIFQLSKKIRVLMGGEESTDATVRQDLVRRVTRLEGKFENIEPRLKTVEAVSKIAVQKTGFLRFNPFQDTGGDQSFVIALLDSENNGFIISSLYTRNGVRNYAKEIINGEPKQQLSEEENRVLEKTISPARSRGAASSRSFSRGKKVTQ